MQPHRVLLQKGSRSIDISATSSQSQHGLLVTSRLQRKWLSQRQLLQSAVSGSCVSYPSRAPMVLHPSGFAIPHCGGVGGFSRVAHREICSIAFATHACASSGFHLRAASKTWHRMQLAPLQHFVGISCDWRQAADGVDTIAQHLAKFSVECRTRCMLSSFSHLLYPRDLIKLSSF